MHPKNDDYSPARADLIGRLKVVDNAIAPRLMHDLWVIFLFSPLLSSSTLLHMHVSPPPNFLVLDAIFLRRVNWITRQNERSKTREERRKIIPPFPLLLTSFLSPFVLGVTHLGWWQKKETKVFIHCWCHRRGVHTPEKKEQRKSDI